MRFRLQNFLTLAVLAIACRALLISAPSPAASVTIDGAQQFQTIEGFGINANHRSWNGNDLKPVLDALIDQAGMNLFRVIYDKTDWEASNDNTDPKVFNWNYYNQVYSSADFQKLWGMSSYLNQRGITDGLFFNFQGIGPDWLGGSSLTPGMEDEWAEMIASLLIYARNTQHLQFSLVGPDNEPDINVQGISMSPSQYVTALSKLAQILDTNGLQNVRFISPDLALSSTTWIPTLMSDPTVMSKVSHFGLHSYSDNGDGSGGLYDLILNSAYPDRTFWMTEFNVWCSGCESGQGGDNSWSYASGSARYLLYHLANGASAGLVWEGYDSQYNYYSPGQWSYWGLFAVDDINASSKTYTPRKTFYALAQISKFVRPGTRRIGIMGQSDPLLLVPFFDPNTKQITICGVNTDANPVTLSATLVNLPGISNLDLYYTDSAKNLAHSQIVNATNAFAVTVPADSVFTLVSGGTGKPKKAFYNGLFYASDAGATQSSGFCSINTTSKGKFTAKLLAGGKNYSISGSFDSTGHAHVAQRSAKSLSADLQIDSSSDAISGTVSSHSWTVNLFARRAAFDGKSSLAPQAGQYTFILEANTNSIATPGGDSFGTLSIDKSGRVRVACWLADGSRGSQSVRLSNGGDFPLYLSPYSGKGFVSGWLNINQTSDSNLNGNVLWTRAASSKTKVYPNGFSFQISATGSRYQKPGKGKNALDLNEEEVVLSGAGLSEPITNQVILQTTSGNGNSSHENVKLNFAVSSGVFKGRISQAPSAKPPKFSGVVLQNQNIGRGYYLNGDHSGRVSLEKRP